MYEQTNALDFSAATPVTAGGRRTPRTAAATGPSCNTTAFQDAWQNLCNLGRVARARRTSSTSRPPAPRRGRQRLRPGGGGRRQPLRRPAGAVRLRPHGDAEQQLLLGIGLHPARPPSTSPRWGRSTRAGRWSSSCGTPVTSARRRPAVPITPMRPTPPLPGRSIPCRRRTAVDGGRQPERPHLWHDRHRVPTPQALGRRRRVRDPSPDVGQRFNGEWLRIRIEIPSDYTCTLGVNPETTAGSCWWGIRYRFTGTGARQRRHHLAGPDRGQPGPPHRVVGSRPGRRRLGSLTRVSQFVDECGLHVKGGDGGAGAVASGARPTSPSAAPTAATAAPAATCGSSSTATSSSLIAFQDHPHRPGRQRHPRQGQEQPRQGRRRPRSSPCPRAPSCATRTAGARRPRCTPATAGWPPRAAGAGGATPASCPTAAGRRPSPSRARRARSAGCASSSS